MTTADEITGLIEDFAADLVGLLPDPAGWGIWTRHLLEVLEAEAAENDPGLERYRLTLELLRAAIDDRLTKNTW